jgi:hypothetical protein
MKAPGVQRILTLRKENWMPRRTSTTTTIIQAQASGYKSTTEFTIKYVKRLLITGIILASL